MFEDEKTRLINPAAPQGWKDPEPPMTCELCGMRIGPAESWTQTKDAAVRHTDRQDCAGLLREKLRKTEAEAERLRLVAKEATDNAMTQTRVALEFRAALEAERRRNRAERGEGRSAEREREDVLIFLSAVAAVFTALDPDRDGLIGGIRSAVSRGEHVEVADACRRFPKEGA